MAIICSFFGNHIQYLLLIFSAVDGIGWELRGPGRYYLGSKNTKQRKQQKQKGKNKDQFF